MSNNGIRLQDLILPLAAGGAAAFSRPAARGIAVGLGALGGVMQQRQEQQRIQAELARAQEQEARKADNAKRLGDLIKAQRAAPKDAAGALGFQGPQFDDALMAVAEYQASIGNIDAAADSMAKARVKPEEPIMSNEEMLAEIQFAKDNPGYTPSFKRRGGGSATFKAPEGPDTEWRDGERYGTEELYNKKTGEPMGKVRPVGQAPKTPKELGPSGLTDAELTLGTKLGGKFEDSQAVKDYVTMSAPVTFVNGLSDKDATGADDQALIYAFAQGMDPRSNVKEGEYDTISRTSLGWFERLGVNAQRVATGAGILTPRARADLKRTLNARYAAVEKQYSSMRSQAITQIDDFLGKGAGERFIPKYGMSGVAPSASPAPPAQAAGITNIHENPQTGERIGWNGSAWVPVK